MSFDYNVPANNQTVYTSPAKGVLCKSFKIDLAAVNATTAVAQVIGFLPKGSQLINSVLAVPTAVSGTSVTAATIAVSVGGRLIYNGTNVFSTTMANGISSTAYYGNIDAATANDATVSFTLTLTGGTVANGGLMYLNLFYVS